MKTLSFLVSEKQYSKYSFLGENQSSLDDFIKVIKKELAKESLRKCREIALKAGFSTMNMAEIDAEIAAYRQERKEKRHAKTGS